jgi:hypothetical protein
MFDNIGGPFMLNRIDICVTPPARVTVVGLRSQASSVMASIDAVSMIPIEPQVKMA